MGPAMSNELRKAQALNASIEAKNRKDNALENRVIKLLLLGAGESGKSTIFKQLRMLHGRAYSKTELQTAIPVIHNNIFNNMINLLAFAKEKGLDFQGKDAEVDKFLSTYESSTLLTPAIATVIKDLWGLDGSQQAWQRRSEYQMLDALEYFIENVDRIADDKYHPNDEDYLRSRVRSSGIVEEEYVIKKVNFKVLDVGGQRNERRKWIHCFDSVTAIIFVAAINEYDQVLYEDAKVQRIEEALEIFKDVLDNELFEKTPIILFLNKMDLFKEKLKKKPLKQVFPEYKGAAFNDVGVSDNDAFADAAEFMKEKFLAQKGDSPRIIYSSFTTATDKDNVNKVFNSTRDIVLQQAIEGQFF